MSDFKRELSTHWSDEELLQRLYGLASADRDGAEHFAQCQDCAARWEILSGRRSEFLVAAASVEIAEDQLQRQRRQIWERIESSHGSALWKWAPAGATALLLALGLLLVRPAKFVDPNPAISSVEQRPAAAMSDTELFGELATMSSPENIHGADALQGLFEPHRTDDEDSF
jgi:hypothetical protein